MGRRRKPRGRYISGLLLLDKPAGITSNGALQEVKELFFAQKAGHTGSLDPLATGILPICFGEATKFSQFLLNTDKKYEITCRLGIKTTSQDRDGEITETNKVPKLSKHQIENELKKFLGHQKQIPPMHSAIKVDGQPLYKLAHKGKEITRESRLIEVYAFNLLKMIDPETLRLSVHCSKGTYARTLVSDLGDNLGCGAHVLELRRTGFGRFDIAETTSLEKIKNLHQMGDDFKSLNAIILPTDEVLRDTGKVELSRDEKYYIMQGQAIRLIKPVSDEIIRLYFAGDFIGIGQALDDGRLAPKRLINRTGS